MTGLGSAIQSALRSLEANQLGLAIASNNISNAQTPGFTRQRLNVRPATDFGNVVGAGVEVVGNEALRDRLLEVRLREEMSAQAENESKYRGLADVEMLFNESGSTGLLPMLSRFFNSFHALSAEPTSLNLRQEVVSNAGNIVNFLNGRGTALADLQTKVDRSLRDDIAQINALTAEIAGLTGSIAEQEVLAPAHELRDRRAVLVQRLAEIVDVHELESNGNYQLTVGNNQLLVYNVTSTPLTASVASNGFTAINLGTLNLTSELRGGSLGAHLDVRDQKLPQYMTALDQLAFELTQQVNSVHTGAYDLNGNTGILFFSPQATAAGAARSIALDPGVVADARTLAVSLQANGTGNEAAIQLGNLLHAQVFSGGSITEQYSALIYTIGSDTANAELGTMQHAAMVHQLENRRQEVSGVSIDEEAVRVLQFQRSFEASARVIKAVDELLQLTLTLGQ